MQRTGPDSRVTCGTRPTRDGARATTIRAPMDSPPRLVLLLGAPRSGTTWLQGLLGAHPRVASPQETDVFSRYLAALEAAWDWQRRGSEADWVQRRLKGLPAVLTTEQFRTTGAHLLATTLQAAAALKPGADIVLEKSPAHSVHGAAIAVYAPDAPIVHLVRDGRDVAASLTHAGRTWGAGWAPTSVGESAAMWAEHVRGARSAVAAARERGTAAVEVRYETLRADGAPALRQVFDALGIGLTPDDASTLLASQSLSAMADAGDRSPHVLVGGDFAALADRAEPEGFFGRGGGGWQAWTTAERSAFDAAAGDLLVELGYEADRSWAQAPARSRIVRRTRVLTARAVRSGSVRLARRIEGRTP